ncbi:MAG: hypothetical protein RI958_634 [Actinomycetota bacterium]
MLRRCIALLAAASCLTVAVASCTSDDAPTVDDTTPTTETPDRAAAGIDAVGVVPIGQVRPGDPTTLPALPSSPGSGPRGPRYTGATVTPSSFVSSSLTPRLEVPGATGAWTFTLDDFSDGTSGFGPLVYSESGPSAQIPLGAGLEQGHLYNWTATQDGQDPVGGTFTVDTQLSGVQRTDGAGGVLVHLSSGEVSVAWSSHSVSSLAGDIGVGLDFRASNPTEPGAPAGWSISAATSAPYTSVGLRVDGTVGLTATSGVVSNYVQTGENTWSPTKLSDGVVNTSGLAPVLTRNPDGRWVVTTQHTTMVFADDDGDGLAHLADISSDDRPVLQQRWENDLLRAISDPVSGREVTLQYGTACPAPGPGFVPAPADHLCGVRFWDGSTAAIHYVQLADGSVSIGRFAEYPEAGADGAATFDIGYDAAGRIALTRSPLVARAAASGVIDAGDSQFWTAIAYDGEGRAASITESAARPGAMRCSRLYDYVSNASTIVRDSCADRVVMQVDFDPTTFFTNAVTNVAGQTATNTWDFATGRLLKSVSFEGLVTENVYEGGQLVESRGPSTGPLSNAQVTRREFDEEFVSNPEGAPLRGLNVNYWRDADTEDTRTVSELGPRIGGQVVESLLVNWPSSPAGDEGGWSALMTGAIRIDTGGVYRFTSGNDVARLVVNQVPCVEGGCDQMVLPAGEVPVQVSIASATPDASIDLSYAGPDTGDVVVSIPTERLSPEYGYATTSEVIDPSARRSPKVSTSRTIYDDPSTGRIAGRTNQAGTLSQLGYERGVGGRGGWGRQNAAILPKGNRYAIEYWGDREVATAPCPGARGVNQGGAAKRVITPGPDGGAGPSAMQWFDDAGHLVASAIEGGATTCSTLDVTGMTRRVEVFGMPTEQWTEIERAVGGNPLISRVTSKVGDRTLVSETEVDLAGRNVRSQDPYGVVITTTYDERTGDTLAVTTNVPGAAPSVTRLTYDARGWMTRIEVDGRTIEQMEYRADGLLAKSTAGNGVVSTFRYDERLAPTAIVRTTPTGETYEVTQEVSAGGHVSADTFTANGQTSAFTYTHDSAGRLQKTELSAGLVPSARTWEYGYDDNSNRIAQRLTVGGQVTGDYTYDYDRADRLIATTDPAAAAGLEYDARGNATKVGPNRFTYDANNQVVTATDGATTVTFDRGVGGGLLGRTVDDGTTSSTIVYASGGVLLDGSQRPLVQRYPIAGGIYTRSLTAISPARWEFNSLDGDLFVVTDDAGATVGSAQVHDPFGVRLTDPVPARSDIPNLTWQANTGNEMLDLETPFVMMGARVYIPQLGRFAQLDSVIGGSTNGYDYAGQNPVDMADPSGRSFLDWLPTIVGTVASIAIGAVIPPASGFLLGAVVGAMVSFIGFGITWAIEQAINPDTEFSLTQLGISLVVGAIAGGLANALRTARAVKSLDTQLREINYTYKEMVANTGPLREWKNFKTAADRVAFVRARPADDIMAQVAYFDKSYSPGAAPTFKTATKVVSYKSVSSESVEQVTQRQSTKSIVNKQYSFDLEQSEAHISKKSTVQHNSIEQKFFQDYITSLFK